MGSTAIIVLICLSSVLLLLVASVLGLIPSHDNPDHQSARDRRAAQSSDEEKRRSMHVKRSAPE